ncbi:MAG: acetate/propionate family kinase [Isosphaeraceae bacterium]
MAHLIAVLNAGSSSLKFSIFGEHEDHLQPFYRGQVEGLFTVPRFVVHDEAGTTVAERNWPEGTRLGHEGAIEHLFTWADAERQKLGGIRLAAVGHRVGHGGLRYQEPVRIDAKVLSDLEQLVPLVPLHQPFNLAPIRALRERRPELPQVACFDTAFHRTQPEVAQAFALPRAYTEKGIRRYGFHGISYEYIASELPRYDPRSAAGRVIVAHLGNGSSLCALRAGRSVATTMGFSSLDGLPMGTRCGSLDPGVILLLIDHLHMDARAIEALLYKESGLLGVSGISSDMRALLASADPRATEAVDLYVYRIGRELGSLAAALGGLDALVFTAGIGEHAAAIRSRVCRDAAWLGLELDEVANQAGGPRISRNDSRVAAWVIPTNEELMIARHTHRLTLA